MEQINQKLKEYIDSLEITKVSFGKLFITDQLGRLAVEVTSKGKAAFAKGSLFNKFNTSEDELLILLREKFKDKTINYAFLE